MVSRLERYGSVSVLRASTSTFLRFDVLPTVLARSAACTVSKRNRSSCTATLAGINQLCRKLTTFARYRHPGVTSLYIALISIGDYRMRFSMYCRPDMGT